MNTGIAFCCICVAVMLMKPDTWLLKIYTSPDTGGYYRRDFSPLMILPVVIGWVENQG